MSIKKYLNRTSPGIVISPDERYFRRGKTSEEVAAAEIEEAWKLDIGQECNEVLGRVEFIEGDPNILEIDRVFCRAARALVERTAEFEQLEEV